MNLKSPAWLLGALLLAGVSAPAAAQTADTFPIFIDFEEDAIGDVPEGFSSVDSSRVRFFDTQGSGLDIADPNDEAHGKGIRVDDDDPGALEMRLDEPATRISLGFGNDDDCCSDPGDIAALIVYRGEKEVGRTSVGAERTAATAAAATTASIASNRRCSEVRRGVSGRAGSARRSPSLASG